MLQEINEGELSAACETLSKAADAFKTAADRVQYAKEDCGKDALSVDKTTLESSFDDISRELEKARDTVKNIASQIEREAIQANKQIRDYNAKVQAQQQAQQQQAATGN